jgi:hypothetical protein
MRRRSWTENQVGEYRGPVYHSFVSSQQEPRKLTSSKKESPIAVNKNQARQVEDVKKKAKKKNEEEMKLQSEEKAKKKNEEEMKLQSEEAVSKKLEMEKAEVR